MSTTTAIHSHSNFSEYLKTLQGSEEPRTSDEGANQLLDLNGYKSTPQTALVPDNFSLRPNPAQNLYYI